MRLVTFLLAILFLAAIAWAGNVYMWKDEDGVVRMGDKPPARQQSDVQTFSGGSTQTASRRAEAGIQIYITSTCPYCAMAIDHLKSRDVTFEVFNVQRDSQAARRMLSLSGGYRGVPFAMIYGKPVRGFSPETYDRYLKAGK